MRLTRLDFIRRSLMLLASVAIVGACTDFSSAPNQLGHLIVTAKDSASSAPVSGIKFTAYLSDRSTAWRVATTDASGSDEFGKKDGGIVAQTYIIRFDGTTPGYTLAASETNDKPANVVVGQTITVPFIVKKTVVGGGPQ